MGCQNYNIVLVMEEVKVPTQVITRFLVLIQARVVKPINIINKNIDFKFSVHITFLESPSSGTLKVKRLEN